MSDITIYKDIDDNGESYCVYIKGDCKGTFLGDDTTLEKLGGKDWEKFIVEGLDNRTNKE